MTVQTTIAERREALPLQSRAAPVTTVDAEARTVEVVWTTGAKVRRRRTTGWDTYTDYDEILVVSRSAIDLSRLERGAPVLDSHSAWRTGSQLAVVERAWIEDGKGVAILRFPAAGIDADIDRFFALVADGQRRNISVGYSIEKVRVEAGEKKDEVEQWFVERWTPHELSFVTIPADINAQVRRNSGQFAERAAEPEFPVIITRQAETGAEQEADMAEQTAVTSAAPSTEPTETRAAAVVPPSPPAPAVDVASERAAAAQAERARSAEIRLVGRKYGMADAFVDAAIETGHSVQEFRNAVLDKLATASDETAPRPERSVELGRQDETVTRRNGVVEYLLVRDRGGPLPEIARDYRGMKLVDLAREVLGWGGVGTRGMTPDEIAQRALHSTSDFPNILAATANKTLRASYEVAPQTFRPFTRRMSLSDFKLAHIVRRGLTPQMKLVNEAGEFKRGTLSESKETIGLKTYGVIVGMTRQMMVNDDLGAFLSIPTDFGQSAATLESDLVWGIVLANPILLEDGLPVFQTAKHKNLAAAGSYLTADAISTGRTAMKKQLDLDGVTTLNITPAFLLVPPELETQSEKILATFIAAKAADVTPASIRSLNVISEARLSNGINKPDIGLPGINGSLTAWYLASAQVDTVVYATLNGQDGPYIESRVGFDVDGVEIKCRHDFGAAAADFRGLYKDPGAAAPL
ncbi:Mu-like prophage major head subunit gpT family protein [Pseudoxanthobacter sp. M-2]|uniref:prohead protease/major capsid protein fusion protein n=1 Tax=Pseudoxanthobacter sp. M-2 TaxID=3078754 RepID=UPI0038FCC188